MKISGPPVIDPGRFLDQTYNRTKVPSATPEQLAHALDPGVLVKGRVVSIDQSGTLTVATAQGSFTASSSRPLAVGQEFWFQVVQTGATPTLAEAGKANAVLNLLRVLLPELLTGELTLPLSNLDNAATGKTTPGLTADESRLLQFLTDTSIDGKANPAKLIQLLSQLELSSPVSEKRLGTDLTNSLAALRDLDAPTLQKVVHLLDSHTAINQQPASIAGSDYFLFPIFFAEQSGRGEWLFSYEKKGGDSGQDSETAISFYLSMTQLGDIHLSINARENSLTGTFTLNSEDATSHVQQHLPQLTEALSPLAGKIVFSCRTAKLDCLKTLREDLMTKVGMERFALVDVKA
ncbi:MAG: flagellar hook-length control protein FliK [Desulfobulbaceae bacterium]|nr:flagellar hook-length control protein FliK [Desulfobulbaceae bacterium]